MPGESLLSWIVVGAACLCLFALDRIIKAKYPELHRVSNIGFWTIEIGLLLLWAVGLAHLLMTGHGF
jgi:heme/copper-type cytochrome/quinol oxidase subunit 1